MGDKCARLTEALVTAGLGSFVRQTQSNTAEEVASNSPKSDTFTDNSDGIEEIDNAPPSLLDDKKDFSGIWETSEQRINTRAPVSCLPTSWKVFISLLLSLYRKNVGHEWSGKTWDLSRNSWSPSRWFGAKTGSQFTCVTTAKDTFEGTIRSSTTPDDTLVTIPIAAEHVAMQRSPRYGIYLAISLKVNRWPIVCAKPAPRQPPASGRDSAPI